MEAIQMSYTPNTIEFTNYNRIDEEIIFKNVLARLKENNAVKIGEKITGPSEEIYNCTLNSEPFKLIYDIDYGPSIKSDNPDLLKLLVSFFND